MYAWQKDVGSDLTHAHYSLTNAPDLLWKGKGRAKDCWRTSICCRQATSYFSGGGIPSCIELAGMAGDIASPAFTLSLSVALHELPDTTSLGPELRVCPEGALETALRTSCNLVVADLQLALFDLQWYWV